MTAKKANTPSSWIDPDDAPELTDEFFENATPSIGDKVVSKEKFRNAAKKALRGRPAGTGTKKSTTVRFDIDILDAFKATGKGWQSRINAALRDWLKEHRPG
jgi:uncharacterized protein (DUF4415 family)